MRYCICTSANLGFTVLQTLYRDGLDIACILTDKKSADIIALAELNKTLVFAGNPREGRARRWIDEHGIVFENLLSINYLFIIESDILRLASNVNINFHGSLLPRYRGRTPTVWSIINGETEVGATAHLMNEFCDDGDIIRQAIIPIGNDETGGEVEMKFYDLYPVFVRQIIEDIESNNLSFTKQDVRKATYYGKRTPDDGEINWDWQKERIRNWVRAQAQPYFPGAFTFNGSDKVIINRISYSDFGFNYEQEDGLVLAIEEGKPIIKTPNGAVVLEEIVYDGVLKKGDILGSEKSKGKVY